MRYTIRWRFLLKFTLFVAVAAVAVHLLHRRQAGNQAGAFVRQADLAHEAALREEQAGEPAKAAAERNREASLLRRYLVVRPDDTAARERVGRLMVQSATTYKQRQEAYYVLDDILRRDPERDALRRDTAKFALTRELRMFREAQGHVEVLLKKQPADGELLIMKAVCLAAEKQYEPAEAALVKAVDANKDMVRAYTELAELRHVYMKKPEKAAEAIDALLRHNSQNAAAHIAAAQFRSTYGKPEDRQKIEGAVVEARKLAPDDHDVLLAAADVARAQGRLDMRNGKPADANKQTAEARELYGKAMQLYPKSPAVYRAAASLEAETRTPAGGAAAAALVRKGVAAAPEATQLLFELFEYQLQAGDEAGAGETIKTLRARGLQSEAADYQEARILAVEQKWGEAVAKLEQVIPRLAPYAAREARVLLARGFEQRGEHDRRLDALTRARNEPSLLPAADRLWVPVMIGTAEAQAALGNHGEALKTYRDVASSYPGVWIEVARLELLAALRNSAAKPDWSKVEEALKNAEQAVADKFLTDPVPVRLLRASATYHRGNPEGARKLLAELAKDHPKSVPVRLELVAQEAAEKKLATLDAAERDLGDSADIRLARAGIWARAKEPDLAAKLAGLAAQGEKFGPAAHARLLTGLREVATAAGLDDAAGKLLDALVQVRPHDLSLRLARLEQARRAKNPAAEEQILSEIARIDGDNGYTTRMTRVGLLFDRAAAKDRGPRDQALAILDALEKEPIGPARLARVHFAQALVHDQNGNTAAAMEKYQAAKRAGVYTPESLGRLYNLLSATGKPDEAADLYKSLPPEIAGEAAMQRTAAGVAVQTDNKAAALAHAAKAVPNPKESKNPADLIWLGRIEWWAGDKKVPEERFRRAIELAPDAPGGWVALLQFLTEAGRKDEAAKTFADAQGKVRPADRPLFAAQGHALLGQVEKAAEALKTARLEKPTDARAVAAEAEYLLQRGRLSDAREGFNRFLALPISEAEKAAARYRLAVAYAVDPDYATSLKALEYLPPIPSGSADNETPAQRRARALVLGLQKDRASKLEAIRLLDENRDGWTAGEQYLLAQLHQQVGNRDRVSVVMTDLLRDEKNRTPLYVGFYAAWLLREKRADDAEEWVTILTKMEPDALPTAELKARLAAAKKNLPAARAAIVPKADAPGAPVAVIAAVCEELELYDDAERLLRKAIDQVKKDNPRAVLALAAFHGRRNRAADGLRICEEARGKAPAPAVGGTAVDILYHAKPARADDIKRVGAWLEADAAKAQGPERGILWQQLAAVRNLQADYAKSATLYQQAIEANPRDTLAMNNLAYLTSAHDKKHDAALGLIESAKKVFGPNPELLDTEALIRLNKGDAEGAKKLLEVVTAEAPSGPAFFHLAQAEFAAKREVDARRAWRRATELNLKEAELHPLEWPAFKDFQSRWN